MHCGTLSRNEPNMKRLSDRAEISAPEQESGSGWHDSEQELMLASARFHSQMAE
jgi:hypothetical protein